MLLWTHEIPRSWGEPCRRRNSRPSDLESHLIRTDRTPKALQGHTYGPREPAGPDGPRGPARPEEPFGQGLPSRPFTVFAAGSAAVLAAVLRPDLSVRFGRLPPPAPNAPSGSTRFCVRGGSSARSLESHELSDDKPEKDSASAFPMATRCSISPISGNVVSPGSSADMRARKVTSSWAS